MPSLPSALAARLARGQDPVGIALWGWRGEEEEVLPNSGIGTAADGRGSIVSSRPALANNWGPSAHSCSQFDANRPKLSCSMQKAVPSAKLSSWQR